MSQVIWFLEKSLTSNIVQWNIVWKKKVWFHNSAINFFAQKNSMFLAEGLILTYKNMLLRTNMPNINQIQMNWPNEERVGSIALYVYKIWGHLQTSCRFLVCQKCWKWQGIRRVSLCLQIEVIKLCIKFTHKGCLTNFSWRWSNIRRTERENACKNTT